MTDIFDPLLDNLNVNVSDNRIEKGTDINLTTKDPTISKVLIALGWQLNSFGGETLDLDVSCFLLNKKDKTRIDEDFVFYNNLRAYDDAIVHNGDNLIGAGEGDDETISIDLHAIPFDIIKIIFVISIYRGDEKDQQMSSVRNGYIRLTNVSNGLEMLRYDITSDAQESNGHTAMRVASLNREGPKWHFQALGELVEGGLATIATEYDIIVHTG